MLSEILQAMRMGFGWTAAQEDLLLHHKDSVDFGMAIKLSPLRDEALAINEAHMRQIPHAARRYTCVDDLKWQQHHPEFLDPTQPNKMSKAPIATLRTHPYEEEQELRQDMKVLLRHNLDIGAGLVNGSIGRIVGFQKWDDNGCVEQPGDSKVPPLGEETPIPYTYRRYVEKQVRKFQEQQQDKQWPIVRFTNGVERVITCHCSIQELGNDEPYSLLSRTQIPLLAGWASK